MSFERTFFAFFIVSSACRESGRDGPQETHVSQKVLATASARVRGIRIAHRSDGFEALGTAAGSQASALSWTATSCWGSPPSGT